jgi:hypothetical protein
LAPVHTNSLGGIELEKEQMLWVVYNHSVVELASTLSMEELLTLRKRIDLTEFDFSSQEDLARKIKFNVNRVLKPLLVEEGYKGFYLSDWKRYDGLLKVKYWVRRNDHFVRPFDTKHSCDSWCKELESEGEGYRVFSYNSPESVQQVLHSMT